MHFTERSRAQRTMHAIFSSPMNSRRNRNMKMSIDRDDDDDDDDGGNASGQYSLQRLVRSGSLCVQYI